MSNIVVQGKSGIRVEVVLHSINEAGNELITFLVDHPRIVHSEELKHRMFSYSAASSRAIPAAKMAEQLTGMPVSFGKNQSGMQAGEEHNQLVKFTDNDFGYGVLNSLSPDHAWGVARDNALRMSNAFAEAGYHKQVYNRLTEPFQMIRVLVSATETDNFFWLRNDKAADPTLQEQARCMWEAKQQSKPQLLKAGEWHLPFVGVQYVFGNQMFFEGDITSLALPLDLQDAIKVSCARCAATSFRNENYGLEKSLQVYDRLVNGDKIHAGALEHCACPMQPTKIVRSGFDSINVSAWSNTWEEGISHMDKCGNLWSGNFKGWRQYRKTIKGENYVA